MKICKYFPSLALPIFLMAGCSAFNTISDDYVLDAKSSKGLIVVSFSQLGTPGVNTYLSLRPVDGTLGNEISIVDQAVRLDWRGPCDDFPRKDWLLKNLKQFRWAEKASECRGRLVALELEAGRYEVYEWRGEGSGEFTYYMGFDEFTLRPKKVSIRFRVKAGEALYLGNILFYLQTDGISFSGAEIIRDMSERDLELFHKRHPRVPPEKVSTEKAIVVRPTS